MLVQEARLGTRILASVRDARKLRSLIAAEGISKADIIPLDSNPSSWGDIKPTHALLSAGVLFARDHEAYHSVNVDWTLKVLAANINYAFRT
jgi:hypothetical protein